jgi:hypothetical protein
VKREDGGGNGGDAGGDGWKKADLVPFNRKDMTCLLDGANAEQSSTHGTLYYCDSILEIIT